MSIPENLTSILARIETARKLAIAPASKTELVAVTKAVEQSRVREAIASGQRLFGENRIKDAKTKFAPLQREFGDLQLHLIGALQTNKVADAVALFDVIHTLDRVRLADALAKERDRQAKNPRLFIQVNTGEEPQKAGIIPRDAPRLIDYARKLGLALDGLMCIPPLKDDPARHFGLLAKLAQEQGLSNLSMGMSADFELAIGLGATHVRVGSAIFGARP